MLNDDDEEIRDLAAQTTSWVLSGFLDAHHHQMTYGPPPAAKYLSQFIVDCYCTSRGLCHIAIERIVGQTLHEFKLQSFQDILMTYRQERTILFEIEKQNLFIDERREVDNWINAFLHLKSEVVDKQVMTCLFEWVSQGLEYLVSLVTSGDEDGCLGWSSKAEVYLLGIRLISIGTLFLSSVSPFVSLISHEKDQVSNQLNKLLEKGHKISLHPHWLSRIEYVLSNA
jgi:hypothetical protein